MSVARDVMTMQRESFIKTFTTERVEPSPIHALKPKEPLPTLQSYCQTKTFLAHSGVNPLAACAAALFSLIGKLTKAEKYDDINSLRESLIYEVKAFECAAHTAGYHSDVILLARYAICATLDECIQTLPWSQDSDWQENNLLYIFQGESWGGDAFFVMLHRLQQDPKQHIELLEFIYLCLSLGFQGKYRFGDSGSSQLRETREGLYQTIRQTRGDRQLPLSSPTKQFKKSEPTQRQFLTLWKIVLIIAMAMAVVNLSLSYLFNITAMPLQQNLDNIKYSIQHET